MKTINALFILGLVILGQQVNAQSREWLFTSGQLLEDPQTSQMISSPYVAFSLDGVPQWTLYDPKARDGRFVANSSTYTGVVAAGFVSGSLKLGTKTFDQAENSISAIAVHADPLGNIQWMHAHESALSASQFHSVIKMADGSAIVSGFEYSEEASSTMKEYALLKRIDREGNIVWETRLSAELGYGVRKGLSGEILWMTASRTPLGFQSKIRKAKLASGVVFAGIEEPGILANHHLPDPLPFIVTSTGHLVTARVLAGDLQRLQISKYEPSGELVWAEDLTHFLPSDGTILPTGLVERPNGHLQVVGNLQGTVILEQPVYQLESSGTNDVLLLTTDANGQFLGHAQYVSDHITATSLTPVGMNSYWRGVIGEMQTYPIRGWNTPLLSIYRKHTRLPSTSGLTL